MIVYVDSRNTWHLREVNSPEEIAQFVSEAHPKFAAQIDLECLQARRLLREATESKDFRERQRALQSMYEYSRKELGAAQLAPGVHD